MIYSVPFLAVAAASPGNIRNTHNAVQPTRFIDLMVCTRSPVSSGVAISEHCEAGHSGVFRSRRPRPRDAGLIMGRLTALRPSQDRKGLRVPRGSQAPA